MTNNLGAYITHDNVTLSPTTAGPLSGLTFAAKDLYDIAGHVTGAGSPDWLASHGPATATASAVSNLLAAGADMTAKAQTDEMAFSITGQNAHYGTPRNVNAPGRIPGGSSSGSAAAVAGGLVDFALGSDTGGSVRMPAGFCGIHGIRTTQDRIPVDGVHPLAPCFDTIGWFARGGELMQKVGRVLLPDYQNPAAGTACPSRLLLAQDCFELLEGSTATGLAGAVDVVAGQFQAREAVRISPDGPDKWMPHFRTLQMADIWRAHGAWIERAKPSFGPGVAERFAACAAITPDMVAESSQVRETVRRRMRELLGGDGVLCLPTAPGIAPLCETPEAALDDFRWRAMGLTCIAGLSGCPQINLPLASLDGCPLGLSLLATPGRDEVLLRLAAAIAP
ncbi:MAG: amidase [Alphaproteobacteria bacterium]|jgi:amidase|nr:amidase [Rhodospirillaceae bacterium]MDP6023816.1 amidase [Alphaproteobacteria bacterium]MDP6253076.1 amidase [Alphaproteobacteria bacterium]MDP7055010.1 amidase [Alphaproteobacteria bacterium]MDP7230171.1 amidase [Alphaproteobacteria bacterium]|tara:strand:- start:8940 stop:10121 length:1182 start_codon:yes stop_codon:yes gene_type:complete